MPNVAASEDGGSSKIGSTESRYGKAFLDNYIKVQGGTK